MKKSILLVAALVSIQFVLKAQTTVATAEYDDDDIEVVDSKDGKPKKSPEERAKFKAQKLKEKLALNDEQAKKTEDVLVAQAKKKEDLHSKAGNDKKALGPQYKQLRQETETLLKEIFTEEQYLTYTKWKEENKQKGTQKQGPGNGRGTGKGKKK